MEHLETFNSNSPKPITVDVIKHAYLNELKNWEEIDINDELFLERLEKAAIQKLENMWDNLEIGRASCRERV